jgi:hypothetical protein
MKKIIPIILLVISPFCFANANKVTTTKKIDLTQYCYYADLEYSEGAEMLQDDKKMRCVPSILSKFKNKKLPKTTLVWNPI